ncbi:MAG: glycosyltransferase [Gemmatimonadota bacterium]|nr:glycosyltransferase [Gemmatimonadota bacterium]
MTGSWHVITGEYPPQPGGVSDYTRAVAEGLADRGITVHVWAPNAAGAAESDSQAPVRVHRLPDTFGEASLAVMNGGLAAAPGPRTLLVQYVPHAFGARGMNLRFCRWVQHHARATGDDVRVMFHEPYFPFVAWPPRHNVLAFANRIMAVLLLSDLRTAYVSTPAWQRRLLHYAPRALHFEWLPIPSAVPGAADPGSVAAWRARIAGESAGRVAGHFGTFGALVSRLLEPAAAALLAQRPDVRLCLIGAGSAAFGERLTAVHPEWADRVTATGALAAADVAACIEACDVMVQPYADGASGRRTTLMAALVNGVPAVTTRGAATEPEWSEGRAVVLADRNGRAIAAAASALLDDDARRRAVGAAGRALYARRFALEHTLARLMAGPAGGRA